MTESAYISLSYEGHIADATPDACQLCGIPRQELIGHLLTDFVIPEHRTRVMVEVAALAEGLEEHGRMSGTVLGSDGIGRRLSFVLNRAEEGNRIDAQLFVPAHANESKQALRTGLDAKHLLSVARQLTGLSRRALDKEELLRGALSSLVQTTNAVGGAALDWAARQGEMPAITQGMFDPIMLQGLSRPAILARLTRGDVVVKDAIFESNRVGLSLVIIPLLSGSAPEGLILLCVEGYTVLAPEEQNAFVILGEIIGLGLRAIAASSHRDRGAMPRRGDREAMAALGKLSSVMTHEINNAITILGNNLEQLSLHSGRSNTQVVEESAFKDSRNAVETIRDLVAGMRAFAPEESSRMDEVNILRLLDTVARAMRFHGKRGIRIVFERPRDVLPRVFVRSHHLIRSLFLVLIELVDAAEEAGVEMNVHLSLDRQENQLVLVVTVSAGPFSLPPVLLAQLEKGGALARHVGRAGAVLTYNVDHKGSLAVAIAMPESRSRKVSLPPQASLPPARRGTVLVVDDDVAVIRSLRRLLERDHDMLAASSAEEALSIVGTTSELDLVLYDISMPRMGAKDFFNEAERLSPSLSERIVFVSSGSVDATDSAFLMDVRNTVIEKPFDLGMLSDLIAAML